MISSKAVIDPLAEIDEGVVIKDFSVIGPRVSIGKGSIIEHHVVINSNTRMGENNHVYPFASIGGDPQDKKYAQEETWLEIGNNNVFRESVTVNRGTAQDGSLTRIGNDNWIMAYVHIAHDCQVADHTIFANGASLAGHVEVGNYAILGGFSLIHQFCRIGDHVFCGMGSVVNQDIPNFVTVSGNMAKPRGINSEGLRRRGYTAAEIKLIKQAYRIIYRENLSLEEAMLKLEALAESTQVLDKLINFLKVTERGILR